MEIEASKTIVTGEQELGAALAKKLKGLAPPVIIGLIGPLGSGKTTSVRLIAEMLGSNDWVNSPSYVIAQDYSSSSGFTIKHWDLYRAGKELPLELVEELEDQDAIIMIEWIDRVPELFGRCNIIIELKIISEGSREVSILPCQS